MIAAGPWLAEVLEYKRNEEKIIYLAVCEVQWSTQMSVKLARERCMDSVALRRKQ